MWLVISVVTCRDEISSRSYRVRDVSFTSDATPAPCFRADVVLRYRGTPLAGSVSVQGNHAVIELDEPALVAPGQAAVWYSGDEVGGGGIVASGAVAPGREATRTD